MGYPGREGGPTDPVLLKALGSLGVKGNTTFWKNHSARLGVTKKSPAAMKKAYKIMPTLILAIRGETKTVMEMEMISLHHKLTQELLRRKVVPSTISYVCCNLFF